jgi:LacI family gluconate utilization system Gnt-I transcriptional repressor
VPTTVTLGGTLFADLLAQRPDIDAVFCVNDDLALGVLFECQRRQIGVPRDLAIVGFNDLEFTASAVPALTSVRTNRYEMGRHAVTMVIDAIEGRRPQEPVIDLGFQLMVRESSMPQSM